MEFKDYGFKPVDVINGLNKYYSEKDSKYLHITKEKHSYWHLLDKDVTDAINWLREEHNIFYTPGMKLEDPADLDIFDTPRYRFLSILSAELGFRTIVGPGNADKVEEDILRVVKSRAEQSKAMDDSRREFLRNLRCELGVLYPAVNPGSEEKTEEDILERIGELKEGNWPCENGTTFAAYMRKQFPKECEKWNVTPLQEGSVHDWVQYIFSILDEWRKRALKDEEELDRAWSHCGKLKGMLNTMYGASCGDNVLPCYRDTCNNPKAIRERDAANDALAELRAKIREIYKEVFGYDWEENQSYVLSLNDINEEYKRVVHNFEERTADWYKAQTELDRYSRLRSNICTALCLGHEDCDGNIIGRIHMMQDCHDKLKKDYAELGEAYSSILKWNNSYADVRRLLGVSADADAGEMVNALNKLVCDYEKLQKDYDKLARLRSNICTALCLGGETSDADILNAIAEDSKESNKLTVFRNDVAIAIGMTKKDSNSDIINRVVEIRESHDKLSRLRSDICSAFCLGHDTCDGNIIGRIHDKLCKDYTEFRKAIWEAMDRKPETLPEETARLVGEVRMLQMNYKNMHDLFVDYGAAQKILSDISDFRKWAIEELKQHGIVESDLEYQVHIDATCSDIFRKLLKRYDWAYSEYKEHYRLRQQWHARYEFEHERANGEHKRAEKLQKDYEELGEAYSSILKWNNSYAEVRRLLGVSADADAEVMISAVKLLRDKDPMDLQKQNDDLIAGYNKLMSYKIQIEKELHKKDLKLSDSERRRKMWMARYESEHKRANGEHRRAESCFNDIAALKTQVSHLMRERDAMTNEEVGLQSLKNAVRKLQNEKSRVIEAIGQDIWDDAVK